jgi:hypothetical protein
LIAGGVALIVVTGVAALTLVLLSQARPVVSTAPPQKAASTLARTLEKGARESRDTPRVGWAVTKATSAHYMMVVEVDTERLEEARGIAIQIVEPVRDRGYEEILVYVRQPGRRTPVVKRIQWTPRGGYVETSFPDG